MADDLGQLLRTRRLYRVADAILSYAKDTIHFAAYEIDEASLDVGMSKLGGLPDLVVGTEWPEAEGDPLPFVAQFALTDVVRFDVQHALPSSGLLSFFYGNYWDEARDTARANWKVVYVDSDPLQLTRRERPQLLFDSPVYNSCAIDFAVEQTLPDIRSPMVQSLRLTEEERAAYMALYVGLEGPTYEMNERPKHRLLGYPFNLRGDVLIESYLASVGRDQGELIQANREVRRGDLSRLNELEHAAADWRLLLQVDSNDEAGMDWEAGSGLIYYCIRQDDLRNRNFNNVQVVAQAH